jgi:neutral ceramidase
METTATLEVGCGISDITPNVGTVLSGFISRENRPSVRVEDPLSVHVLAMRQGAVTQLLISYDLLGISESLEKQLLAALGRGLGSDFSGERCVFVATHAHSSPPTSPLEGEADPDPAYCQHLCDSTVKAAHLAMRQIRPASLYLASVRIPGLTYNRRAVLADGRVSMALEPDAPVLERGPVDDTLTALVWRDENGKDIAVVLHFACHGVALYTQAISSDIPGALSRRVGEIFNAPCLFLQGASGDINPITVCAGWPEMNAWVDQFMHYLEDLPQQLYPLPGIPLQFVSTELPLVYQPLPPRPTTEKRIMDLDRIGQGDVNSPDIQQTIQSLGNIMNIKPGECPDPGKAAFAARALANAERRVLAAIDTGQPLAPCRLRLSLWRVGLITLAFVAAELFSVTGFRIRALGRRQALLPVTHLAPIVGYVPDSAAMDKGGYEVDDAWRFYRHPAPFAQNSEQQILEAIMALTAERPQFS